MAYSHLAGPRGRWRKRKKSVRPMGFFLPELVLFSCLETGVRVVGKKVGCLAAVTVSR